MDGNINEARPGDLAGRILRGMAKHGGHPSSRTSVAQLFHAQCPKDLPVDALDASPQAIAITNTPPQRQIVFANKAFCKLTGYSLDEVIGKTFAMFSCPETELDETLKMRDAVLAGHSVTAQVTCRRKDDTRYRIRTHVCPITDHSGDITHWVSFQKDITSEDAAYARLAEVTERLEATIDATGDGVWDWEVQTGDLHLSERCMTLLGVRAESFLPRIESFVDLVHPQDVPRFLQTARAHLLDNKPFELALRILRPDGQPMEVICKGRANWDHNGNPLRMAGTISDVSELTQINRRLLRTESIARIGNWDLTLSTGDFYWSPEVFRIFGFDPDAVQPSLNAMISVLAEEDQAKLWDAVEGSSAFALEARLPKDDGNVRHLQFSGEVELDHEERPVRLYGMVQDITRRKEQEERVQQARRMEAFGQLAGGVAHDFNNLLAVIMGNLELLKEGGHDPTLVDDLINDALRAVHRGRDLTGSLLNYTHKAVLQPRRVNANAALEAARRIVANSLPGNIRLTSRYDPSVDTIKIDPAGLETSLIGLLMNARDALINGGEISLHSRKHTALAGDPYLHVGDCTNL